mmetsp:Transcript_7639/g.17629  ORF Transcript_7639/g.17629 Transcript_7639/m.17629 type:complete len:250 (-) Transcript_7639:383-1132(-)
MSLLATQGIARAEAQAATATATATSHSHQPPGSASPSPQTPAPCVRRVPPCLQRLASASNPSRAMRALPRGQNLRPPQPPGPASRSPREQERGSRHHSLRGGRRSDHRRRLQDNVLRRRVQDLLDVVDEFGDLRRFVGLAGDLDVAELAEVEVPLLLQLRHRELEGGELFLERHRYLVVRLSDALGGGGRDRAARDALRARLHHGGRGGGRGLVAGGVLLEHGRHAAAPLHRVVLLPAEVEVEVAFDPL